MLGENNNIDTRLPRKVVEPRSLEVFKTELDNRLAALISRWHEAFGEEGRQEFPTVLYGGHVFDSMYFQIRWYFTPN